MSVLPMKWPVQVEGTVLCLFTRPSTTPSGREAEGGDTSSERADIESTSGRTWCQAMSSSDSEPSPTDKGTTVAPVDHQQLIALLEKRSSDDKERTE